MKNQTLEDIFAKDDILISIRADNGPWRGSSILRSSKMKVFVKNKSTKWKQLGLIQQLLLKAHCKVDCIYCCVTFPEHPKLGTRTKKLIENNILVMKKIGCKVLTEKLDEIDIRAPRRNIRNAVKLRTTQQGMPETQDTKD